MAGMSAVIGIETSCDETAVALYSGDGGLLAQRIHSQAAMHAEYGGVVPELAARDHVNRLHELTRETMHAAAADHSAIEAVAYTAGPGLAGALLTGAAFAAGLATAWDRPLIAVHHLEGHLLAPRIENPELDFPFIALLVSGGHTMLIEVAGLGRYRLLGESLDDAAGEAFDKTAKLLGLPYPGGPELARLAESGQPDRFTLPRPMLRHTGMDFSFSGLKTAVATALRKNPDPRHHADLARAFEDAVVDVLTIKSLRAIQATGARRLVIAGGVGANQRLRQNLSKTAAEQDFKVYFPSPGLCTDNAAMIAHVGWLRRAEAQSASLGTTSRARWPLTDLTPP